MLTPTLRVPAMTIRATPSLRLLSTASALRAQGKAPKPPLQETRTGPMSEKDLPNHPGYTSYEQEATSAHPKDMKSPNGGSAPNR